MNQANSICAPHTLRHSMADRFKSAAALAALAVIGLTEPSARATVLWEADTSRGTTVFEGLETAPGDIGLVNDPKGIYGTVYRYRTWDDSAYQKERAESKGTKTASGNFRPALGGTYYIGWRSLWNPMPTNGSWVAFWQMHGYGPAGQGAPLVFRALGGDGNLYLQNNVNGTDVNFWNTPLRLNAWNTYVLQIHLATDTSGWVELWYNGVRQTFINGQQRYNCPTWDNKAGSFVMFKWGVYRSGSLNGSGDATAYMSRARIGTTYADVDPLGAGTTSTVWEAEGLARTTSGPSATIDSDAKASAGARVTLNATAASSWVQFTLPTVPAGTYAVQLAYKSNANRGQATFSVDGASVGSILDQYAATSAYPTAMVGTLTFATTGSHTFRMIVAGKNISSSSYTLSADKITLVRQ